MLNVVTPGDVETGRREVIDRWGPWIAFNIRLGQGVYTIAPDVVGNAGRRVARIAQVVADLRGTVAGTRILDRGSHEGGFGIELALHGADVVCVEGREKHIAKTMFAKECLGLERLEVVQADVHDIDPASLGTFDVVLCFGLL